MQDEETRRGGFSALHVDDEREENIVLDFDRCLKGKDAEENSHFFFSIYRASFFSFAVRMQVETVEE